jgi:hypothetical protein
MTCKVVGTATLLGYLDNLGFDKLAQDIGKIKGMESWSVRTHMIQDIESRLKKANMPYSGPTMSFKYPVGGYFFKTQEPSGDAKEDVLKKLNLNSLKMPISGYKDSATPLGFIVMRNPEDTKPRKIDFTMDDTLRFTAHVNAFHRQRTEKTSPFFYEVGEEFKKRFPVECDC